MSRKIQIPLVDDSKFPRPATEACPGEGRVRVSSTRDGERALEIAREKKPDVILLHGLPPQRTGPDGLRALNKDPATAGIAVVMFTGLPQKNAAPLPHDGACAFLENSQLGLERGEALLTALAGIVRDLQLDAPPFAKRQGTRYACRPSGIPCAVPDFAAASGYGRLCPTA